MQIMPGLISFTVILLKQTHLTFCRTRDTHHTHIGQSQSLSQVKQTSQAKQTCMRSGQKSVKQHAQAIGYCGDGGKGPTG